jgi:hypothetical protein
LFATVDAQPSASDERGSATSAGQVDVAVVVVGITNSSTTSFASLKSSIASKRVCNASDVRCGHKSNCVRWSEHLEQLRTERVLVWWQSLGVNSDGDIGEKNTWSQMQDVVSSLEVSAENKRMLRVDSRVLQEVQQGSAVTVVVANSTSALARQSERSVGYSNLGDDSDGEPNPRTIGNEERRRRMLGSAFALIVVVGALAGGLGGGLKADLFQFEWTELNQLSTWTGSGLFATQVRLVVAPEKNLITSDKHDPSVLRVPASVGSPAGTGSCSFPSDLPSPLLYRTFCSNHSDQLFLPVESKRLR